MKSKKHNVSAMVFYSVIIVLAVGLLNMVFANPLPDTGQTKCYNNTVEIPCPQPGEPFYGQDAQYGPNTHSYTDLSNGIVRDNVTGLEWQQATAPATYTWQQAIDYCNNLSLGGKDDWRLPTVKELSILDDSSIPSPGPTINTEYFPDTHTSFYWSSTYFALRSSVVAWGVNFSLGLQETRYMSDFQYVRAVRGGQTTVNTFIDNNDGTVTDTITGLMWQQETTPGTYTWEQSLAYCENLTLAGHSDWRLPNRNELYSLVDYRQYNPAINTNYFPHINPVFDFESGPFLYYWSSTSCAFPSAAYPSVANAYIVDFLYGNTFFNPKSDSSYIHVWAVRGGILSPTAITLSSFTATPKQEKLFYNGLLNLKPTMPALIFTVQQQKMENTKKLTVH